MIFDVDGTLVASVDVHAKAWQDAFRDYGREIFFDVIRVQIGKGGDQPMPVFLHLQDAGIRTALASSAKEDELETYKRIADIKDLDHEQTSSNDAEKSKPHPDIFLAALERLNQPSPREVVVVGDTPYDVEAAGKAGLRTIGVLCGGFSEQSLRDAGCIAIYATLRTCSPTWITRRLLGR